jgi:hypothetical protein
MEFVKDLKRKKILLFLPDMLKDKKGAVFVRFSYNGMIVYTVLVVVIS